MKKLIAFGLLLILLGMPVLASPESDAVSDFTNQGLCPCTVTSDGTVVQVAYTLPETKDLTETSLTAYVIMAYTFKSFPEAEQYEIYQYVGPLAITKYTVAAKDVAAVLFEGMPASAFWDKVQIEEIPEASIEPEEEGSVLLGLFIIFVLLGFVGLVIVGVIWLLASTKKKQGKK